MANSYSINDIAKLRNDKEVFITTFSESQKDDVLEKYSNLVKRQEITSTFQNAMLDFANNSNLRCELNAISTFKYFLSENELPNSSKDISSYLKLLRSTHEIDDILYELLDGINTDFHKIERMNKAQYTFSEKERKSWTKAKSKRDRKSLRDYNKTIAVNDTASIYSNFSSWPDERSTCLYKEINVIKTKVIDYKSDDSKIKHKRKTQIVGQLNKRALLLDVITPKTFMKLEYLRNKSFVRNRYLRLEDYLKVVFRAKNKMKPHSYNYVIKNIETENEFSSESIRRFSKLTRRKDMYEKFNETQIVLMAQVLQKASRRMGVDPDVDASRPVITQSFEIIGEDGIVRNYVEELVLDPQSQFNLARRRMRKDIIDLEGMDLFNGTKIYYDEVVMAAFETGYLSIEDIEFAVRYDDLWNPTQTRFERISGFIFSFTGYATFFVPPPYNVTASLGLAIIQGIVNSSNVKGEDNDNAATFIQ
jgi:hypothetical protein